MPGKSKTEADGIQTGRKNMMTKGKNYLWVSVYRNNLGDCTGGGVSSRVSEPTLFFNCTREEAIHYCEEKGVNPDDQLILVKRQLWGEDHFYAEPLVKPANAGQCNQMFGGNYIMTSDSRFPHQNGLRTAYPIPVHDRFEVCL